MNQVSEKTKTNKKGDRMYFTNLPEFTIEHLRAAFHKLCLEMHPDKEGGDHDAFVAMKREYDRQAGMLAAGELRQATEKNREPRFTSDGESALADMLWRLLKVAGIEVEICGSWIWISGDTYRNRERLKTFGLQWSKKKKSWYWSPYLGQKRRKGRYTMKQIRRQFGSAVYRNEEEEQEQQRIAA